MGENGFWFKLSAERQRSNGPGTFIIYCWTYLMLPFGHVVAYNTDRISPPFLCSSFVFVQPSLLTVSREFTGFSLASYVMAKKLLLLL